MDLPETETTTRESTTQAPSQLDLSDMRPWREFAVVLFNDEHHTYDEVVIQLCKAVNCTWVRALSITRKVDREGRATAVIAPRERAVQVARILREIDLRVVVRQIN